MPIRTKKSVKKCLKLMKIVESVVLSHVLSAGRLALFGGGLKEGLIPLAVCLNGKK